MSTLLRTSRLIELCTPSISYDRQVQAACEAFDKQMYSIMDDTGVVVMIPNIMGINDPNLIDILAWQFHVDFYDAARDLEFRKNLVQQSISWHRRKGTVALVQEVLDTYWPGGATIVEWFDYMSPFPPNYPTAPGWHDRYRFRVYVDEQIIQPADEAAVLELIDRYKPVSRWCEGVYRAEASDCLIGWCGMLLRFVYHESEEPERTIAATKYGFIGPTTGGDVSASSQWTLGLLGDTTVDAPVTVTLHSKKPDGSDAGGTFNPPTMVLTTEDPAGHFTYTPAGAGDYVISSTNDGGLIDPPPKTYTAVKPPELPETIVGLEGWWEADRLTLADGAPCPLWPDISVKARDAVAVNPPYFSQSVLLRDLLDEVDIVRPRELEGTPFAVTGPALYFPTAANAYFNFPAFDITAGWTLFFFGWWGVNGNIKVMSDDSGGPSLEMIDCDGQFWYFADAGHRWNALPNPALQPSFMLVTAQSDHAASFHFKVWQNGIPLSMVYGGGWGGNMPVANRIGMRGDGSPCNAAYMKSILAYRGVLSNIDRMTIDKYILDRFSIAAPPIGAYAGSPVIDVDQTAEGFGGGISVLDDLYTDTGTLLVSTGGQLDHAKLWIQQVAAPVGNVVCRIWDAGLTKVIATSDPIAASAVPTALSVIDFTFSGYNRIFLASGQTYGIFLGRTGSTNCGVGSAYGSKISYGPHTYVRAAADSSWFDYPSLSEPFQLFVIKP